MTRAALLVVLTLAVAAPAQDAPKRYAVLIGVNEYDHPALPALRYSVADATELADALKPAGYDVTLLADGRPTKPTKEAIDAALTRVLRRCRPGDTVVVAFSGHGLQFQGTKDAFFCPSDARPSLNGKDSLISLSKLYADMSDSFAGVKLLLVDACRNDPGPDRDAVGLRGVDADSAPNPPRGVAAFFSCSAGERAVEHKSLGHGVFFHYVLKGIKGEARNSRGAVTFNSLTDYVAGHVADEVPKLTGGQAKQSPNLKADLSGASPVLLTAIPSAPPKPAGPPPPVPGQAAFDRGMAVYLGRGVGQDMLASQSHFRTAAEAGNPDGMYYLGQLLRMRNDPACRGWLEKADRAGHPLAAAELAFATQTGVGSARDEAESNRMLERAAAGVRAAAEAGEPTAMNYLGHLYGAGRGGVRRDDAEAVRWYRKSADAGHPSGMYNLGTMYAFGRGGLAKDVVEADRWSERAAAGGDPGAMSYVGSMYENGWGGRAANKAEAVKWYRKAAAAGNKNAADGLKRLGAAP